MEDNRGDELDRVIDRALRSYASTDPLDGLEQRVIDRVHAHNRVRGRWSLWAAVAVAALAALIVAIALVNVPRKPEPAANVPNATEPVAATVRPPAPPAEFARKPEFRPRRAQRATRVTMPRDRRAGLTAPAREPRFPAPAPLTHEERVLTAWAARMPAEVTSAFADLRKRTGEPVSVQEIQLPPLSGDGANEEKR